MISFLLGFVIALVLAILPAALFLRTRAKRPSADEIARDRLEELSRLTGGLAHEIKNPLSTIMVNLKLICEDLDAAGSDDAARQLRKIRVVQKETQRLHQILDDFLRYIGKPELNLARCDINRLIGEMADFYSPQAQTNDITIRRGLADGPIFCDVDSDLLKQVILNLFINAQQAMPDGGELIIRTSADSQNAFIEVSDTGRGIAPDKLDKVFQAYYTSKSDGTGLGLSTAAKIVKAHKGTISVDSQMSRGTSFTIALPIAL